SRAPQRDGYARRASERLPWRSAAPRRRLQEIAERLGRGLVELDRWLARTGISCAEIALLLQASLASRPYTISLKAL
ncbi:zinc transporter ZntB, partial [Klebsiella pneumoniae]|nr:zinc transporter ZntB [Klebsiella pneumoniae]